MMVREEKINRLIALRNKGLIMADIANAMGVSYSFVQRNLRKLKVKPLATPPRQSTWPPKEEAEFIQLYESGASILSMARHFNRKRKQIERKARILGLFRDTARRERAIVVRQNEKILRLLRRHHPEREIAVLARVQAFEGNRPHTAGTKARANV